MVPVYSAPKKLAVRIADESIVSGSLLTVEGNEFCVLKARGAIVNVFETGQHTLTTPDKLLIGSFVQSIYGGSSPWVYEVIYINRAKLAFAITHSVNTSEMVQVDYHLEGYVHVDTVQGALALVQHLPFSGNVIDLAEISSYAGPIVSQSIAQIVQATPLIQVYSRIEEITTKIAQDLSMFLCGFGILLSDMKIVITPHDPAIRELIGFQTVLGLSAEEALRYHLAFKMMEKGLITAPNAAAGASFNISGGSQVALNGLVQLHEPTKG